jgi:hypothetical protein
MAILLHSFAALVLCNLASSLLFERTHVIFPGNFYCQDLLFLNQKTTLPPVHCQSSHNLVNNFIQGIFNNPLRAERFQLSEDFSGYFFFNNGFYRDPTGLGQRRDSGIPQGG